MNNAPNDTQEELRCMKCNEIMTPETVQFEYLGNTMSQSLPKCPKCGMIYISDSDTEKIKEIEMVVEDK